MACINNIKCYCWFRINCYCISYAILTTIIRTYNQLNGKGSCSYINISRTSCGWSISITKAPAIGHCSSRNSRCISEWITVAIQTLCSCINGKSWYWFRINRYCLRNAIHTTIIRSNYQFNNISTRSSVNIGRTCCSWSIAITKVPAISHCTWRNSRTICKHKAITIKALRSSINSKCRSWFRINSYCFRNAIHTTIIWTYY